jgi:hypothetical protein
MDPNTNGAGGHDAAGSPSRTLELGGELVTVERPSALKATRALAILRELSRATPELLEHLARFRQQYEADNVLELDRVQAKLRYPPRPIVEGSVAVLDEDGAPRMLPSPVDRLTEEDWQAAGGVYRVPASPSTEEVVLALFDRALELAEDTVYRFLTLFTISNRELKAARRAGTDAELIAERTADLLDDSFADELIELAVVVSEVVDGNLRRKTTALGPRMAGAASLLGLKWTTPAANTTASTDTRPSSSTASPASTDGDPTTSSTPPSTSSSSSAGSSPTSTSDAPSPSSTPEQEQEPAPA